MRSGIKRDDQTIKSKAVYEALALRCPWARLELLTGLRPYILPFFAHLSGPIGFIFNAALSFLSFLYFIWLTAARYATGRLQGHEPAWQSLP